MNHGFGHEVPARHSPRELRQVTRYLVVISAGAVPVARLFTGNREPVAEIDAGAEEVAVMTAGAAGTTGATGTEWNRGLVGHSAAERASAIVYALDL